MKLSIREGWTRKYHDDCFQASTSSETKIVKISSELLDVPVFKVNSDYLPHLIDFLKLLVKARKEEPEEE